MQETIKIHDNHNHNQNHKMADRPQIDEEDVLFFIEQLTRKRAEADKRRAKREKKEVRRKELDPSSFSRPKEDLDNSDVLMEMPLVDPASYSYTDLLDFFNVLLGGGENQGLASIKPPAVSRFGAKKTAWSNFVEICESLNREEDHLKDFIFSELGTDGAKDAQQRLLLKGKFNPRNIESLLRRYIIAYVQCTMCRSLDTELKRDPANRLYFMHCNACRSSKSVANIKKGFHATTKQDRREARK